MSESPAEDDLSLRALMGRPDYIRFWLSRVASTLGVQIQSVALGWQVYAVARETMDVARSAFYVGMIGLAAFIPVFLLALPAGETADRHDRKTILRFCYMGEILTALVLVAAAQFGFATLPLLLGVAVAFGTSRAFMGPAGTALGPMLVPRSLLPRAIALNSLAWQSASILGPAIGGILVAISPGLSYAAAAGLYLFALACVSGLRGNTRPEVNPGSRLALIKEGLSKRLIFAPMLEPKPSTRRLYIEFNAQPTMRFMRHRDLAGALASDLMQDDTDSIKLYGPERLRGQFRNIFQRIPHIKFPRARSNSPQSIQRTRTHRTHRIPGAQPGVALRRMPSSLPYAIRDGPS
jgi:MFS family permease